MGNDKYRTAGGDGMDALSHRGGVGGVDKRPEKLRGEGQETSGHSRSGGGRDGLIRDDNQLPDYAITDSSDIWGASARARSDRDLGGDSAYRSATSHQASDPNGRHGHNKMKRPSPVLVGALMLILLVCVILWIVSEYMKWAV